MRQSRPSPLPSALCCRLITPVALTGCGGDKPNRRPAGAMMKYGGTGDPRWPVQPTSVATSIGRWSQTEGAKETKCAPASAASCCSPVMKKVRVVKAGQKLFQIDRAPLEVKRWRKPGRRGRNRAPGRADQSRSSAAEKPAGFECHQPEESTTPFRQCNR